MDDDKEQNEFKIRKIMDKYTKSNLYFAKPTSKKEKRG